MFETADTVLSMIGIYAAVGFFLAVLYNLFRFPRLAFPKRRILAAVLDFLFAVIAGFVLFVFSAAYGSGFFRLFCRFVSAQIMRPIRYIRQKVTKIFIENRKILSNSAEKIKKYLKSNNKVVYNNTGHNVGEVYPEGGENRNAVKAKVRKII